MEITNQEQKSIKEIAEILMNRPIVITGKEHKDMEINRQYNIDRGLDPEYYLMIIITTLHKYS